MYAGSFGASHGANSANATNTTINTIPATAKGLRFSSRRIEKVSATGALPHHTRCHRTLAPHQHFALRFGVHSIHASLAFSGV
jgi:uncharacterized protein involved in type VI secretion and phage assembly